jgi:hypothetical protein
LDDWSDDGVTVVEADALGEAGLWLLAVSVVGEVAAGVLVAAALEVSALGAAGVVVVVVVVVEVVVAPG